MEHQLEHLVDTSILVLFTNSSPMPVHNHSIGASDWFLSKYIRIMDKQDKIKSTINCITNDSTHTIYIKLQIRIIYTQPQHHMTIPKQQTKNSVNCSTKTALLQDH